MRLLWLQLKLIYYDIRLKIIYWRNGYTKEQIAACEKWAKEEFARRQAKKVKIAGLDNVKCMPAVGNLEVMKKCGFRKLPGKLKVEE